MVELYSSFLSSRLSITPSHGLAVFTFLLAQPRRPHATSLKDKVDEYALLYGKEKSCCDAIIIYCTTVILSGLCLTIISCRMSGARSLLSLYCSPLHWKTQSNWRLRYWIFLCRINWNHIFAGNYQYIFPRELEETQLVERRMKRWWKGTEAEGRHGNGWCLSRRLQNAAGQNREKEKEGQFLSHENSNCDVHYTPLESI